MTLPALLLIVALATLLIAFGFRRFGRVLYVVAFAVFLAVGCGFVPRALLKHLQTGYGSSVAGWSAHNDIVLLGSGSVRTGEDVELTAFSYGRLTKAFELYRDCKSHSAECHLISSGGDVQHYGKAEADLLNAALLRLGAEPRDLVSENRSLNTWQNAQFSAAILAPHRADSVVLVTSGLHLRRSVLYFEHFGVRPKPVRGDYVSATVVWWPAAYNFWLADAALHEFAGVLRYHIYSLMGWNVKAVEPGSV